MKKILSLISLCLLILIPGCLVFESSSHKHTHAPENEAAVLITPVYVDSSFTDKQKADIAQSLKIWNDALVGQHKFEVVYVGEITDEVQAKVEKTDFGLIIHKDNDEDLIAEGVLAYVDGLRGHNMFVETDFIGERNLVAILIHEAGHVLGLPHIIIQGTVMAPSYALHQPNCIDEITARELVTVRPRDFKLELINYCKVK